MGGHEALTVMALAVGFLGALLVLAIAYFSTAHHALVVERRRVEVDAVVKPGGFLVAHLSDFHYDFGLESRLEPVLAEASRELAAAQPDVILLTGDYVNKDPRPVEGLCQRFVRELQALSKHGVFASLGNHDAYGRDGQVPPAFSRSEDFIADALGRAGARVLRNDVAVVCEGVCVGGLEDLWNSSWSGHKEAMEALQRTGQSTVKLLMSHNPDTAQHLKEYDYDVQFSGHTHGGQICLPSLIRLPKFGAINVPVLGLLRPLFDWLASHLELAERLLSGMRWMHKYSYVVNHWEWAQGLHLLSDVATDGRARKYLSVGRGVGTHRNMRLFCPPELTLLTVVGRGAPTS